MSTPVTLETFAAAAIPLEEWNHRAHLTVAYLLLREFSLAEATDRMRAGIQRYNTAHKVPMTPMGGYHETLTVAWMRIMHAAMTVDGHGEKADAFFEQHPDLLSNRMILLFYSRERILSWEARMAFVEPDVAPLPAIP